MASAGDMSQSKRPHVKTERMQEFMKAQGDANSPVKKLKCPEPDCNKSFTSAPGLKYHLQTHKTKNPQFSCRKCYKVFKSANGLKYHRSKTGCDDSDMLSPDLTQTFHLQRVGSPPMGRHVPRSLDLTTLTRPAISPQLMSSGPLSPCGQMDKLTELAIIATSPQSPLLQRPKPPWADTKPSREVVRSLEKMLNKCDNGHEEDTEGVSTVPSKPTNQVESDSSIEINVDSSNSGKSSNDGSDPRVSTSSPLCVSADDTEKLGTSNWSHSWPTAVWQCFISGTRVQFSGNSSWQLVDDIARHEELAQQAAINYTVPRYAPDGLQVQRIDDVISDVIPEVDQSEISIHFIPKGGQSQTSALQAVCKKDHPFFVKDKGWTSLCPPETVVHYGIPCSELCVGDVCLPPCHSDACFSEEIFKSFEEFDFTPEDTSAVFALSSMRQQQSPPPGSGITKSHRLSHTNIPHKAHSPAKAKRPMNAFLLFARDFRVKYAQKIPKRDNRVISVMLGERWKALPLEERKLYEEHARLLADEQKKIHPDCWKRKK